MGKKYTTGCLSLCDGIDNVMNGSCSGIGCYQTSIPMGVTNFQFTLSSYSNQTNVLGFNPCSYAFVAKETAYNFFSLDLKDFQGREKLPVVFDWAVGYQTYIDECNILSPCNMTCINLPGKYSCSCPNGYEGDGMKNGIGCNPIPVPDHELPLINIALGRHKHKQINATSLLLMAYITQTLLFPLEYPCPPDMTRSAKIVTADDLKKATNNYHESRVLDQGGQGTVYKGILSYNTIVAIKKSIVADQSQTQIEQFINEVIILSQVNHTNVVKLLGCCLETQVPLLVYEFITDGTLYDHIHAVDQSQLTTLAQGTLGYLDLEYFHTSQLSEKSDVYGFGAVLKELVTGKKALSFNRPEVERNLTKYFVSSMKDHLFEIVDEQVMNEAKADQLKEVSVLAKRCLRVKGNERPTTKEVAMELEGLRMMEKHPWVDDNKN
ncbi:unnamed protein product [Camellia sinensis]